MSSSRGTTPPPSQPSSSRNPPHPHAPITPSGLREAHTLSQSPEEAHMMPDNKENTASSSSQNSPRSPPIDLATRVNAANGPGDTGTGLGKALKDAVEEVATETTTLLKKPYEIITSHTHDGPCNHGTFSPRIASRPMSLMGDDSRRPPSSGGVSIGSKSNNGGMLGNLFGRKTHSTTSSLAERHGVNKTSMYVSYYVPFFAWIPQYKWSYLQGDIVAALTMASFYIPMALSYASNLAHVPPINGLYSFVFNPLIYALLGSCPQMVVGPEAAGSLLVGSVVRSTVDSGKHNDADEMMNARVAGVVTGIAGAVIFIAGLTRLGFLDSVLSRPFLRGFISAIGFVIVVDQLIPEMGLAELASNTDGVVHGSSVTKLGFLINNATHLHALTFAIAFGSFAIIMFFRELKKRLSPRYPNVAYIPDRFIVVVSSAILCWAFEWNKQGLEILGEVKSTTGNPFPFHWPFQTSNRKHITEAMGTSFLIALLGFFESSVAAKSIGGGEGNKEGLQGVQLSPNRELVALGVANLVGGCFCALPAFGGYGRSKVNASTGGKTPMSSVFLSIITIICVLFLLPYFYYLPKAVLSSMITVVAWSLIEEAPHDIAFFVKIRGWTELALMTIIFAATILYSLTLGIAIGVGLSILSVIKHSTRPRIQILGRIPGTNRFENAEDNPEKLEFVEGCLIVKIPEPLTFANTGDLKSRLRRLELYGTNLAHPALPRTRPEEHNKNIIFDIHGVTGIDGSGTQVLREIVTGYRNRGVNVFFTRGPVVGSPIYDRLERSGIIETIGGPDHVVGDVESALRLTEIDIEYGAERM